MHNIYIRPLCEQDAETSFHWRNDPEIWTHTGTRPDKIITLEIENAWIKKVIQDKTSKRFAIIADENYIGNIQLTDITEDSAVYHIFLGDKRWWGKKISQLATYQILHYAKEELGLKKIHLSVQTDNLRAIASYLRSSFTKLDEKDGWINMVCLLFELPPPAVSIFCMVYNHGKFLKEALEGFLTQKTNFSIEIVIGEDCSTDNSREIILEYATHYPGQFKLLLHEKNIGANENQIIVLQNCCGKYVALCEGDDYWTDTLKLQKQVDFLEANKDFSICFHKATCIYEENIIPFHKDINVNSPDVTDLYDIVAYNYIHTPTVIFRNHNDTPTWLSKAYPGDWPLHIINATYGKIKFLPESMAVYRIHSGGVHSTTDGKPMQMIKTINFLINELMLRGFVVEAKILKNQKNTLEVFYMGINNFNNLSIIKRIRLILYKGNYKTKYFFFLPLFGRYSSKFFKLFF